MAGPYCKDCKNFEQMIRSESGECRDRTKIIYAKYGDRKNEPPTVLPTDTCSNWTEKDEDQAS